MLRMEIDHTDLEECEPGYLLGDTVFNDCFFHIEFIRVVYNEQTGMQNAWQLDSEDESNNNETRLEDLVRFSGCSFTTMTLPEREGEWVMIITPHGK